MSDDRPARYIDDGIVVYRASSLGGCDRMLVACSQPYERAGLPAEMREIFAEGHAMEDEILRAVERERDMVVADEQRRVALEMGDFGNGPVEIRGSVDGLAYDGVDTVLVEAKKFRESGWDDFVTRGVEVRQTYPWQVSAYMYALDVDLCWFVGGRFADGKISEILVHEIHAPLPLKALFQKVERIEGLIHDGWDAREVDCRNVYPCPYFAIHDPEPEVVDLDSDTRDERTVGLECLRELARINEDLAGARKVVEGLEKEKRDVAGELRRVHEELGGSESKRITGNGWVATRVRKTIPEHTRRAVEQDYYTVKKDVRKDEE